MKYVELKNCSLTSTNFLCPACQTTLLQKITVNNLTDTTNFKYYLVCPNTSCNFLGSPDVHQVTCIYEQLKELSIVAVDFNPSAIIGYEPMSVTFTASAYGISPSSYTWVFGDGTVETTTNPKITHTYNGAGLYTVQLNVFDTITRETYSVSKLELIDVRIYVKPSAQFGIDKTTGQNKLTCKFTDLSIGSGITSWMWDFGDGNTSTIQNPIHTYSQPGKFTVTLLITNNKGETSSITKPEVVVVSLTAPVANFSVDRSSGYVPMTVNFTYEGKDLYFVDSYLWTFGDGSTSTEQNPTHIYTVSGIYTVQLEVTNSVGSDALLKNNAIVVQNPNIG